MGNVRVSDMLGSGIGFDIVLHDHLRHNVYPPMPELVGMADRAINAVVEGESDLNVYLPDGGRITAQEAVDGLHLGPFVEHKRDVVSEWVALVEEARSLGFTVELVEYIESADSPGILGAGLGVCIWNSKQVIRIRERLRAEDRTWVLEHELGHARIYAAGGDKAEQTAYDEAHYADPEAIARKHRINDYLYPEA